MKIASFILLLVVSSSGFAELKTSVDTVLFSQVKIGFSRDAILRVENIGVDPLEILSISVVPDVSSAGEFVILSAPTSFFLAANEWRNLLLRFIPTVGKRRTAFLQIETSSGRKDVYLIGDVTSTQPDVHVRPAFIDFGAVPMGDTVDSSYTIYGAGIDSIDIFDLLVNNASGGIFFETYPKDDLFAFPEKIGPNDSLVIGVRFNAFSPSGIVTGSSVPLGEVSGDLKCDFRGEIGFPELSFSEDVIDIGVRRLGEVVDTFVYLQSEGNAAVELQEVIPPIIFTVPLLPSVPQFIQPSGTIKVDLRFTATTVGAITDVLGAIAKSNASGGRYRQVALRAIVLPDGLTSQADSILNISCINLRTDSLVVTVSDTGSFPITIDSIQTDNTNVRISSLLSFPLTLSGLSSRTYHLIYTPNGVSRSADSTILSYYVSGHVVFRDTVYVNFTKEALPLSASAFVSTPNDYTDSITLQAPANFDVLNIPTLEYTFSVVPGDIADIDIEKFNSMIATIGTLRGTLVHNSQDNNYHVTLSSSSIITNTDIDKLIVPIRYYVSKQTAGVLRVTASVPGSQSCLENYVDTISISSPDLCGDEHIQAALNNRLNAEFISTRLLTNDNRYKAYFQMKTPADVTLEWYTAVGELISATSFGMLSDGIYSASVNASEVSSGSLIARLISRANGKEFVVSSLYHLLK